MKSLYKHNQAQQNHQAKLIVFDWDGTLMDSEAQIVNCLRLAITDLGLTQRSDDALKDIIGLGLREALFALYPQGSEQELNDLTARYRDHFFDQEKNSSELFDGARELIERLAAEDYFLAVATGKGRHGLDKVLRETQMGQHFHMTRCANESISKPHPQMMLEIIDYFGIEANEAIMVGDTEYDLQMANNAGSPAIAVTYGVHDKNRLLECNPLTCVDSVAELSGWLLNEKVDAA